MVEQPGGSLMEFYDKMEWLFKNRPVSWWQTGAMDVDYSVYIYIALFRGLCSILYNPMGRRWPTGHSPPCFKSFKRSEHRKPLGEVFAVYKIRMLLLHVCGPRSLLFKQYYYYQIRSDHHRSVQLRVAPGFAMEQLYTSTPIFLCFLGAVAGPQHGNHADVPESPSTQKEPPPGVLV